MIVCVEGPSGAGKSTLVQRFPAQYHRCPLVSEFIGGFPQCGSELAEVQDNCAAYLAGEVSASLLMSHGPGMWVQDRNWISQMTFLLALRDVCEIDTSEMIRKVASMIDKATLAIPSVVIYLRCAPSLTEKRRGMRGSAPWGDVPPWLKESDKPRFRQVRHEMYDCFFESVPFNLLLFEPEEVPQINEIISLAESSAYNRNRPCEADIHAAILGLVHHA